MAGGSFLAMLRISGFFAAVWGVGKLSKFIGVSSIVFEITIGLIFSPTLLPVSLMPPPYAECQHKQRIVFGVQTNMFDYYCNRDQAIMSLDHSNHHHLTHMLHHRYSANEYDGCHNELKAFDAESSDAEFPFMNYQRVTDEHGDDHGDDHGSDAGGSHRQLSKYRRMSSGGSAAPWVCQNSTLAADTDVDCGPFEKAVDCTIAECDKEIAHLCGIEPNFFTLIGHTGVSMMIFESGMHFDFAKAGKVGPWASVIAVLGTFLPLIFGLLLVVVMNPSMEDIWTNGVAAGVALAPTSVGIALKLLLEAKQLQKDFGQCIITAAFVDDILSLILFNLLFGLTSPPFSIVDVVVKPVVGVVWMALFGSMGMWFWPKAIRQMNNALKDKPSGGSLSRSDEALLLILFVLLLAYGAFTFVLGTHLWGCFIAGMSFADIHHAHVVWSKQTKRITAWMLRIFFSCTVAFAIPFASLMDPLSFAKGSVLGIIACIATKVLCAFFMGNARFVIGWAMVGRAEFAYLIAEMAKSAGIMNEDIFAQVIWALLYATIFAPFIFRKVLATYASKYEQETEEAAPSLVKEALKKQGSVLGEQALQDKGRTTCDGHKWLASDKTAFRFQIVHMKEGSGDCSLQDLTEIWGVVKEYGMRVTQVKQQCDMDTHFSVFQIETGDGDKPEQLYLDEVQDKIYEGMKERGAHIIWLPPTNALHQSCKLAKLTMVVDTAGLNDPVKAVADIVENICGDAFFVMRSTMELHGKSMLMSFLIAHADAKAQDARSPPASPRSPKTQTINRYQSRAEFGMEHLLLGSVGLPEITPQMLEDLKKRIDQKFQNRLYLVIDPVSYAMGPLGAPNHDAATLAAAQMDEPTVEIRFFLESMNYELFAESLKILSTFKVTLLSARLDERAFCQINLCVMGTTLKDKQREILSLLHQSAEDLRCIGYMDKTNLESPDEKETMLIGESIELDPVPIGKAAI